MDKKRRLLTYFFIGLFITDGSWRITKNGELRIQFGNNMKDKILFELLVDERIVEPISFEEKTYKNGKEHRIHFYGRLSEEVEEELWKIFKKYDGDQKQK